MTTEHLFREALNLKPVERLSLIDLLSKSLDEPDLNIDKIWAEESEKRVAALKAGKLRTIPLDDIIKRYR